MASEMVVFDSIAQSNIPRGEKSMIRKWAEKKLGVVLPGVTRRHIVDTVEAVRAGGEAAITGAALGAIHAKAGLDVNVHGKRVPADAVGGIVALAASPWMDGVCTDVRNIGMTTVGIAAFRQGNRVMSEAMLKSGQTPKTLAAHGEGDSEFGHIGESFGADDDPIDRAARAL